jgi:acetoin utilization protein AcuB
MLVRDRMTSDIQTVTPTTTVADALAITRSHAIRHLPVTEDGRLVGLVTDRDLRLAMPAPWEQSEAAQIKELSGRTVAELMTRDVISVGPDVLIEDAAKTFYEKRIGCLLVMEGEKLAGILTASDLLRAFVDIFTAHDNSSRLEVRMPNRPGELARVVRLIGIDHKLNITGMVLTPEKGHTALMTMHVQTRKPQDLMDSLEKMGYEVGCPSLK